MPTSLFDLTGRVALITGGGRGLGKAMAEGLAEAGAQIVISSRKRDELEATAAEIRAATGAKVVVIPADMMQRDDVARLAQETLKEMGRVDILINNAGINRKAAIDQIPDEDWDAILEVNLTSCMVLSRALVPQMKERRWGRIIYTSSIMALASKEERNAYSATKSALLGLARANSLDLGAYNITVNCIAPGPFLTDMPRSVLNQEQQDVFAAATALGRWGQPRELAGPVVMLASEAGSYITGAVLVIDGGTLAKTF